ncbi:MAG: hypothetical protein IPJ07_19550 [Acidobacteria bacterium]|nr:hypothetical protein [Acidobacteriota bacterium]
MQADPLGLGAADAANPQSLNLYSYVGNDPVNFTDPTGLFLAIPPSSPPDNPSYVGADYLRFLWYLYFNYNGRGSGGGGDVGGGGGGGGGGGQQGDMQNQQEKNQPCGEPPWDQAIGPNGIYNQLLNPIGVAHNWIENAHTYRITNSGSFSDFEGRVKVNGWERFSNDPHLDHWGDNDYRKQYNGEWYHFSMGRPGKNFNPDIAGPVRFSLHWEEAKPGGARHFSNFVASWLFGIPIKAFHPCTRIVVGHR